MIQVGIESVCIVDRASGGRCADLAESYLQPVTFVSKESQLHTGEEGEENSSSFMWLLRV